MFPVYVKPCPEGVYEKIFKVTDYNTDEKGMMQPGDLARETEKITEEHLKICGLSREEFRREKKLWVVAWTSYWITRLPECGDTVLLRVWSGKRKNAMYPRKYAFYTQEGLPLVCASSLFVLMHSETRKLAEPISKLQTAPEVMIEGEPKLPRLKIDFPDCMDGQISRTVQEKEIDINGHLNNSCYLDWATELAGKLSLGNRIPGFVWVKYNKELVIGQEVALHYELQRYQEGTVGGKSCGMPKYPEEAADGRSYRNKKDMLYIHGMSEGTSSFMLVVGY